MRCMTVDIVQTSSSRSAPVSSVMLWVSSTLTVTLLSMTPWFVWFRTGTCATRLFGARETSDPQVMTRLLPLVTPSARWHLWQWKWSGTSTKKPLIFRTTMTVAPKSQQFCQPGSQTYWSTVQSVLPLVWRQTSRLTTSVR